MHLQARVQVLLMLWDNIEGELRQTLIPALLKRIQQDQVQRKKEIEENQSWKVTKPSTLTCSVVCSERVLIGM
jgi:predicted neuraminidase